MEVNKKLCFMKANYFLTLGSKYKLIKSYIKSEFWFGIK